jgi:hypothetical protein
MGLFLLLLGDLRIIVWHTFSPEHSVQIADFDKIFDHQFIETTLKKLDGFNDNRYKTCNQFYGKSFCDAMNAGTEALKKYGAYK